MLGATQVAVMELSVGAGLVTVLMVYALSVVGEDALDPTSVIPKPLALGLVGAVTILLGWMVYPAIQVTVVSGDVDLASVLWQSRVLDVWIQIVLIFPAGLTLVLVGMFYEWIDRKLVASFQNRIGSRWFQPFSDAVKLFAKKQIIPGIVNPYL